MFRADLLQGKRVLVTGGGTGLGKSMGRRFLELGAELVICGRREAVLEETVAEFPTDYLGRASWPACGAPRRAGQQRRRQLPGEE